MDRWGANASSQPAQQPLVARAEPACTSTPVHTSGQGRVLASCLKAATLAPSVHNTQPWRFLPRIGTIDVYSDRGRRLSVLDPRGREMTISIGASLLNLRVAILNHGRIPLTRLLPEPTRPDLLARVTIGQYTEPDRTVRALAEAIPHRHTNRRPFTEAPISDEILTDLAAAARSEGAQLTVLDDTERATVLALVRAAEQKLRTDAGYREELTTWTSIQYDRRDGVPRSAIGPWDALETLPLRDFGIAHPSEPRRSARFEPDPTLVVISTPQDTPEQWLRAGQALERVLLTATVRSLATTPITQPLEIPEMRTMLAKPGDGGYPQVILRLGYGRPSPPSPRLPLADLLLTEPPELAS